MHNILTKNKFYTKCKSLIKMTKIRVEILRKKKATVAKYLKNDIIELLRGGLDYNAYGRVEGLNIEQNVVASYDFVENFCNCISSNLSTMSKQRECPEECREAVQSLIYAAARFADFPELRELRSVFTERYRSSSLELFINKEFVESTKPKLITKEIKLQLLRDIALENSIQWDSQPLETRLSRPTSYQDQHRQGSLNKDNNREHEMKTQEDKNQLREPTDDAFNSKDATDLNVDTAREKRERELVSHFRKTSIGDKLKHHSSSEDHMLSSRWSTDRDSRHAESSSFGSASEDEREIKKPISYRSIPPPYIKSKEPEAKTIAQESPKSRHQAGADNAAHHLRESEDEATPKPRSVRRRRSKLQLDHDTETAGKPLKPPPGHGNLHGLSMLLPDAEARQQESGNREEGIMDELLLHYSAKRQPDRSESEKGRARSSSKEGPLPWQPGRGSVSDEQATSTTKPVHGHTRAISLGSESFSGRVHPKLPDFSELKARIASLKRELN